MNLKVAQHKLSVQVFGSMFLHLFKAFPARSMPGIGCLSSPFPARAGSLKLIVQKNNLGELAENACLGPTLDLLNQNLGE